MTANTSPPKDSGGSIPTISMVGFHWPAYAYRNTLVDSDGNEITETNPLSQQIVGSSGNIADVNPDGQLHVVMEGKVDTGNSSSTPLIADGVFTGTSIDTLEFAVIVVSLFSDQESATDGLEIEQSTDSVNWDHCDEYTIPASTGKTFSFQPQAKYLRIVYTNGNTEQTVFRMQTTLKKTYVKPSSHRIQDPIIDDDDAELVKAVITGKNASGTFVNFQATTAGNFKTSIEELESAISSNNKKQLNVTNFDSTGIEGLRLIPSKSLIGMGDLTVGTSEVEITFTGTTKTITVRNSPDNSRSAILYIGKTGVLADGSNYFIKLRWGDEAIIDYNDVTNALYAICNEAAQVLERGAVL